MIPVVAAATLLASFWSSERNRRLREGVEVDTWGIDLTYEQIDACRRVFHAAGIGHYFHNNVLAIYWVDKEPVAVLSGHDGDELSVAVHPDEQGQGLATVLIAAFLDAGGTGFMVAGTEAGAGFLWDLPIKLGGFPEELEVSSWDAMREEWAQWQEESGD
jgi:GNAT superfamily N-acetyltransferase